MKRHNSIIIALFCIIFSSPVLGEEAVYLDLGIPDIPRYNTGSLQFENPAKDIYEEDEDYLKPSFGTLKSIYDEDFGKPKIKNTKKDK